MLFALLLGCVAVATESTDTVSSAVCPPADPTGIAVGASAQDVMVTDCAGTAVSLHSLCGQPALIANWYGWCPSCGDNAALAQQLAAEHPDLAVAVVLDEDPLGAPVDAEFCAAWEETYPSEASVWMDPDKALEVYGSTDLILVLDRDGILRFDRETADQDVIVAAVEGVLAQK